MHLHQSSKKNPGVINTWLLSCCSTLLGYSRSGTDFFMNLGYQIRSNWQCKAHVMRGTASNPRLKVMDSFLLGSNRRYRGSLNACPWGDQRKTRKLSLQTSAGQKRQVPSKLKTLSQTDGHHLLVSEYVGMTMERMINHPRQFLSKCFFQNSW